MFELQDRRRLVRGGEGMPMSSCEYGDVDPFGQGFAKPAFLLTSNGTCCATSNLLVLTRMRGFLVFLVRVLEASSFGLSCFCGTCVT